MRTLRQLSFLALACALAACSPPPFNLDISASARTASRMSFVGRVGPIEQAYGFLNDQSTAAAFFPERDAASGITTQAGFVRSLDPSQGQILTFLDSSSGSWKRVGPSQNTIPASTDPYPNLMVRPLKYGHSVLELLLDDAAPWNNQFAVSFGDPSTNSFPYAPTWIMLQARTQSDFGIAADHVVGMSFAPRDAATGFDMLYLLIEDLTSLLYQEVGYQVSATGLVPAGSLRTVQLDLAGTGVVAPMSRYLYFYDPLSTYAVAQWNDGSGWKCVKWTESSPGNIASQSLPGITHRLDAMLANGQLVSTEDQTGRLYDQSGNQLAEFSLRGLHFVGEAYLSGAACLLFSQAMWQNEALYFNVYSIESTKVASLAK